MLRNDGTIITSENLTATDIALSPFNVLEELDSERAITGFLQGALHEAPGDLSFYRKCLAIAAQARFINQLAADGADREALCNLFQDAEDVGVEFKPDCFDAMAVASAAFAVPLPAAVG
jgi:DNA-binding phage protein